MGSPVVTTRRIEPLPPQARSLPCVWASCRPTVSSPGSELPPVSCACSQVTPPDDTPSSSPNIFRNSFCYSWCSKQAFLCRQSAAEVVRAGAPPWPDACPPLPGCTQEAPGCTRRATLQPSQPLVSPHPPSAWLFPARLVVEGMGPCPALPPAPAPFPRARGNPQTVRPQSPFLFSVPLP